MRHIRMILLAVLILACITAGCTGRRGATTRPSGSATPYERGTASWYGKKFHGRRTASGERYDMHDLTAAHPSLPFDTNVRVVNTDNGRSVVVRINDRGPFVNNRIIDLSHAAARELDMVQAGLATVELYLLE